jgi:hypothetical protein
MRNILWFGREISLLEFLFALACAGRQKPVRIERGGGSDHG